MNDKASQILTEDVVSPEFNEVGSEIKRCNLRLETEMKDAKTVSDVGKNANRFWHTRNDIKTQTRENNNIGINR